MRISRIIYQLLKRLPEVERFRILELGARKGSSLSTITDVISSLGAAYGKYGGEPWDDDNRLVTIDHVEVLENLALERIREAVRKQDIFGIPNLSNLLYRWREWATEEEVRESVRELVHDTAGLARFIEIFLQNTHSFMLSDRVQRINYRLDPKWLEPFLDTNEAFNRAKGIDLEDVPNNQKIALLQFIKEYEIEQEGGSVSELDFGEEP